MKRDAQQNGLVAAVASVLAFAVIFHSAGGADLLSATNWSGSLSLVLDNAVRIKARGQPARSDLQVEFVCRDGRWEAGALAWFDRMPALEHPVTLTAAEGDAETLKLDFLVKFTSHAPVFAGGAGTYSVELRRALGVIRGDFEGRLVPLGNDQSTNLWITYRGYALGSTQKPDWPMGLEPGRVCSLRRPDATVRAAMGPLPRMVMNHEPVKRDEHPRLFVRQRDVEAFAARLAAGEGSAVAARLEKVLETKRGEWWNCAGSEAAGWAVLRQARGDDAAAAKSGACAKDAMAFLRANPHSAAYGRNLAGIAFAYDLCAGQWPEEFRRTVCAELAAAAVRVAACLPQTTKADALLAPGQLFQGISFPYDYRFGYVRAAAGLALLAVDGDSACEASPERVAAADAAIACSVARLLRTGIGEHGEGTGNQGYADLVEVLFPYLQAYRSVRGRDLAAGTGAEWTCVLGIATRGACFRRGRDYPAGAWIPFTVPVAVTEHASLVHSLVAGMERRFDDPWHGAMTALNWPEKPDGAGAASPLPAILEDWSMGTYVLTGAKGDRFLYFRGGAGPDEAGAIRGDVCLYAAGREWIVAHAAAPGEFSWPAARNCNTISLMQDSRAGHKTAVVPTSAGYIERVRFDRANGGADGSGSVCMRADAEGISGDRPRRAAEVFGVEGGGAVGGAAWRIVGADFSGVSGADVLVVMVDGCFAGAGEAERYWEMDAGPVPADRVVIGPGTFLVRPDGTNASMQGVFIYPGSVDVAYVPPDRTKGGRIRAFLNRKATNKDLSLDHAIRTKAFGADIEADLRTTDEVKGDERKDLSRQKQSASVFETLRRESYSVLGPDQQAANSCVVVLTVQQGEPPRVEPASKSDGYMVKVGEQTVWYQDSAVVFGAAAGR